MRHVAVDDCGTVLNPLLVEGQQHGGIAAGIGQALYEEVRYDDDGNPLTATLADYGIPSAAELPSFEVHSTETPTPLNPLGAKGIGEAATIGSTPAVQNAVIDALAHLGVPPPRHAVHARAGVAGDPRRRGRHACPTRGASRRRSSPRCAPARPPTRKASTPPRASDPSVSCRPSARRGDAPQHALGCRRHLVGTPARRTLRSGAGASARVSAMSEHEALVLIERCGGR